MPDVYGCAYVVSAVFHTFLLYIFLPNNIKGVKTALLGVLHYNSSSVNIAITPYYTVMYDYKSQADNS